MKSGTSIYASYSGQASFNSFTTSSWLAQTECTVRSMLESWNLPSCLYFGTSGLEARDQRKEFVAVAATLSMGLGTRSHNWNKGSIKPSIS